MQRGPPGRGSDRRHRRHHPGADELRQQGRLHPPPRAVPVLRVDRQPAPPARRRRWRRSAPTRRRYVGGRRSSTPPTTSTTSSDFNALRGRDQPRLPRRPTTFPRSASSRPPATRTGTPGTPIPYDEQQFVTTEINALEQTPDWSSTAVIITYDDSDGFYDHVFSGVHNPSNTSGVANPPGPQDFLNGTGLCGPSTASRSPARTGAAATARGCRSCSSHRGRSRATSTTR